MRVNKIYFLSFSRPLLLFSSFSVQRWCCCQKPGIITVCLDLSAFMASISWYNAGWHHIICCSSTYPSYPTNSIKLPLSSTTNILFKPIPCPIHSYHVEVCSFHWYRENLNFRENIFFRTDYANIRKFFFQFTVSIK